MEDQAAMKEPQTWAQALRRGLGKDPGEAPLPAQSRQGPSKRKEAPDMPNSTAQRQTQQHRAQPDWESFNLFDMQWTEEEDEEEDDDQSWQEDQNLLTQQYGKPEAVDVENDHHVEQRPRMKRMRTSGRPKNQVPQKLRRMKCLEEGLLAMQAQLASLTETIMKQTSISTLMTAPSKGAIMWPQGVELPDETGRAVPGDGFWQWHAALATLSSQQGTPLDAAKGLEFRDSVLDSLKNEAGQWAQIWGCEPSAIHSTAEEWRTQWADARALLTISTMQKATIVVFNRQENLIETIAGRGVMPFVGRVLVLEYLGGHYNPLPQMQMLHQQQIQQATHMEPWKMIPGYMKGGAQDKHRLRQKFWMGSFGPYATACSEKAFGSSCAWCQA